MIKMRGLLFIDTTQINNIIIEILIRHLGEKEALELANTDCIQYIVKSLLDCGWIHRSNVGCNQNVACRETIFRILSDYMDESFEAFDSSWWHEQDTYSLVAASIASDYNLNRSILGALLIITPACTTYALTCRSTTVWELHYVKRD